MESSYRFFSYQERKASVSLRNTSGPNPDQLDLSPEAQSRLSNSPVAEEEKPLWEFRLSQEDKRNILLLKKFMEKLTGREIEINIITGVTISEGNLKPEIRGTGMDLAPTFELDFTLEETIFEQEEMSFKTRGTITTSQGEKVEFHLELDMNREFFSRTEFLLEEQGTRPLDPLVINFDGRGPRLDSNKIAFDLNADGEKNMISFLEPGSGFLVWDRKGKEQVQDGRDLFGPATGNGFAELAAHDHDQNGWIDRGDPIFSELRIWTRGTEGNKKLICLDRAGVGAIYLGNISTPYSLNDRDNNTHGLLQKTGLFLGTDHTPGTIHHLDLMI